MQVTGLAVAPGDDEPLVERGFVASVRMLDLVGFLEDTFRIRLRAVDLVPENLATINLIADLVATRLTSKRSPQVTS
jgi:acyl carrier protein